jgi:hypothetical protein
MDNRASDYSLGIDRGEWIEFPAMVRPRKKLDPEAERLLREHLDRVWARNLRMERDL